MTPVRNALLICVVFLCGLEETVLSQYGHCVGNQCFALFQKPQDFPGAQESCKTSLGQLFTYSETDLVNMLAALPRGLSGRFWLELHGAGRTTEEASAGLQNCSSVSVTAEQKLEVLSGLCSEHLNGYLCQYTLEAPCSPVQAAGGAQVKYQGYGGFEVLDSETFPQATVAVVEKVGGEYPDSRHLCFSGVWMAAPWACEVLDGGCEHSCNSTEANKRHTCVCPAGQSLHPNKITCGAGPCARCAQECQREGDAYVCKCSKGYRLAQDGKSCVDVNECEEDDPCTGEGEQCKNTQGSFQCWCREGFEPEDGVCVDVSICLKCEHMNCNKSNGVYECVCNAGFRVSAKDPTKCKMHCTERDCLARCDKNTENGDADMRQCDCPDGYILHMVNDTAMCSDIDECENEQCDHKCENFLGGHRCLCNEGYTLYKGFRCEPTEEPVDDYDGSGSAVVNPTEASTDPASVPSYIKAGSALGIFMFGLLCGGLILLVLNMFRRCGRFELSPLKHQNIDIFHLQQVSTETYKRLSFDKSLKNDSQIP
ncbi:thrombomodulin-like [Pagrus major]|uniref:thrombomodulin-like n=1 Tax=Pagrus major TaxID=143350 RepID=UPI003CC83B55